MRMVTDHNHAPILAQNFADTRGRRERQTEDEAWRKSSSNWKKKGAGPRTQKIIIFLGDLHVPWFRADTPIGRLKKTTIDRQSSNWAKGLRKQSSLQKGVQLTSSLTQVKLHLLNFRADDPNNWEVTEFFCQTGSRIRDSWPSGHGLTPSRGRKRRKSNDHICLQHTRDRAGAH